MARPEFVKTEMLTFLDELRKSGKTNMYGARPYLMKVYPELSQDEAGKVLLYWMDTFGDENR